MTALPFDLSGLGVTSGISATAGERNVPIDSRSTASAAKNSTKLFDAPATGISIHEATATNVPQTMKGILRPALSLSIPNIGSMKSASTLSSAIITPDAVSFIPNMFLSISGITVSYICQNALIAINARPTRNVRL